MVGKKRGRSRKLLGSHQRCWLWGRHAVVETLRAGRWRPWEIHCDPGLVPVPLREELEARARSASIPLVTSTGEELARMCGSRDHQGLMAKMPPFPYASPAVLDRLRPESFVLVLDGIQDPFNFGAILRSADLFGVDAVLVPQNRQSPVTAHVARSSAGGVNYLDIVQSGSLPVQCERLRSAGLKLAAATGKGGRPPAECDFRSGLALVIGNEGEGIDEAILHQCDEQVCIPQSGHVGSLNAAVAAGILCYEVRRQRAAPLSRHT